MVVGGDAMPIIAPASGYIDPSQCIRLPAWALQALLAPLDLGAAAANDFGRLFADRARFPSVWAAKDAVAAAEAALQVGSEARRGGGRLG